MTNKQYTKINYVKTCIYTQYASRNSATLNNSRVSALFLKIRILKIYVDSSISNHLTKMLL